MTQERKTIHVVSNSHWDREWGYPFEETRLLLLKFMDELLELLENDPEFHSFTMDSQTLCVEDYLELRPEKRSLIEKHVKSGRLLIYRGIRCPRNTFATANRWCETRWYHRGASAKVTKSGYTPFSYGRPHRFPDLPGL